MAARVSKLEVWTEGYNAGLKAADVGSDLEKRRMAVIRAAKAWNRETHPKRSTYRIALIEAVEALEKLEDKNAKGG